MGWLLPALLLLPEAVDASRHRARQRRRLIEANGDDGRQQEKPGIAGYLEDALQTLVPTGNQRPAAQGEMPTGLMYALRWWLLVQVSWGLCCVAAPLFAADRE